MTNSNDNTPLTNAVVKLIGENGNAFAILGRVRRGILHSDRPEHADEFNKEARPASLAALDASLQAASGSLSELRASGLDSVQLQRRSLDAVAPLAAGLDAVRQELSSIPARTAEEIAARPAPALFPRRASG